jgi:hypothetical protein
VEVMAVEVTSIELGGSKKAVCGVPGVVACLNSATGDKPDYDHDHDDHQNNVNQRSANVEGESKKPKYEQDYRNSPKHASDGTVRAAI